MTDRLRGALAEIADHAPVADIPHDLWQSAHRPRRRTVIAAAVAAAAVVVSAAGLGVVLHDESPSPVGPIPGAGAVPSHIYMVPDRLASRDSAPLEPDLAIGTASVAYATREGVAVAVTARDGHYHLLDLPGFVSDSTPLAFVDGATISLSPDGGSLAYAFASGFGDGPNPEASGIRVVDLSSGDTRSIDLGTTAAAVDVRSVSWSPDSRWLVWSGYFASSWTGDTTEYRGNTVRGRVAPGSDHSRPLPSAPDAAVGMAIDDDGRVSLLGINRLRVVAPAGTVTRRPVAMPGDVMTGGSVTPPLAYDRDGHTLAMPSTTPDNVVRILDPHSGRVRQQRIPQTGRDGATSEPLGWAGRGRPAYLVSERVGGSTVARRIAIVDGWTTDGSPTYSLVSTVDPLVPDQLSVAVDLLSGQHLARDFPPPDWPGKDPPTLLISALAILGALGLGVLVLVLVTRRRSLR